MHPSAHLIEFPANRGERREYREDSIGNLNVKKGWQHFKLSAQDFYLQRVMQRGRITALDIFQIKHIKLDK